MEDQPIVPVAPPWKLKGTVHLVNFYCKAGNLPEHAYSPLEGASAFAAAAESGKHLGGISQFQFIRYTETPVGPYDELIIAPGFFQYAVEEGGKRKLKKNVRITRIYVSQKYTCWNGRHNWNIPKHLARFEWEDLAGGSTRVKVFPHDTTGQPTDATPSDKPLFQATFQPIKYVPSIPFAVTWAKYIGLDISLVQPPLPEGQGAQGELPGTDRWCKLIPSQFAGRATLGWVDMSQRDAQGTVTSSVEPENFWPGIGRWQVGLKLEDANIIFDEGVHWDLPRTNQ